MPNNGEVGHPEQRPSQPCRLSVRVEESCSQPGAQLCPLLAPNMDILFFNPSMTRTLRSHSSLHSMPAAHLWHFMAPPDPGSLAGWGHLFLVPIPRVAPILCRGTNLYGPPAGPQGQNLDLCGLVLATVVILYQDTKETPMSWVAVFSP